MKIEVEVKSILEPIYDSRAVLEKAMSLGFIKTDELEEEDTYFNLPPAVGDFVKTDEALRVRRVKDLTSGRETAELTYKGPKIKKKEDGGPDAVEIKTRNELQVVVSDGRTAASILESLRFTKAFDVKKKRDVYVRTGSSTVVCHDRVDGLGNFIEVECVADVGDGENEVFERACSEVTETVVSFGVDAADLMENSYLEMLVLGLPKKIKKKIRDLKKTPREC